MLDSKNEGNEKDNILKDELVHFVNLGWRVPYLFVTTMVLAYDIVKGNQLFSSLTIFSVPIFFDYLKFNPTNLRRRILRTIGLMYSGFWFAIGFVGLIGILKIKYVTDRFYIAVDPKFVPSSNPGLSGRYFICGIFIFLILSIIDGYVFDDWRHHRRTNAIWNELKKSPTFSGVLMVLIVFIAIVMFRFKSLF